MAKGFWESLTQERDIETNENFKNEIEEQYDHFLGDAEEIEAVHEFFNYSVVLTNKKIIHHDKKIGKKGITAAIPYQAITSWSLTSPVAGKSTLEIFTSGDFVALRAESVSNAEFKKFCKTLSNHI